MAERDEKTSKTIIVLRPPSTEFFPNHPQRIKKWGPILGSHPIPFATLYMSIPNGLQIFPISLINDIFVARKALLAYLIISAVVTSERIMQQEPYKSRYNSSKISPSFLLNSPIMIRSGFSIHFIAFPS